ncbi:MULTISPECIES: hypothetical protein [Helicobacter]|uniref:Uncharacterized protein n=1 Tax=Helicobacter bilis ATCC 43879 TaxID=613026 RepID=C3XHG7_9HELI|nr:MULTISPECIES: hypothetical protein [Helicobacter]EEO24456.1 hypothetical protein HRAG_01513 [Helicobacter bilis ATCC 43879]
MKKLVFVLLSVICVYANPANTITKSCDKSYNEIRCGNDLCIASRCFYKNLSSIEEAFQFYLKEQIQQESLEKPANRYLLVLKYMLNTPLPKVGESNKYTADIRDYYADKDGYQNICNFEFKRTKDSLIINFNACYEEEHSLTFIQKAGYIEILDIVEAL